MHFGQILNNRRRPLQKVTSFSKWDKMQPKCNQSGVYLGQIPDLRPYNPVTERQLITMNKKPGTQSTLLIRILNRQHSTWQGTVTWVDKNETLTFRSALELIKMIDSTVGTEEKNSLLRGLGLDEKTVTGEG